MTEIHRWFPYWTSSHGVRGWSGLA